MDPATLASLMQLIALGVRTYERNQAGELTDAQAKAIYDAACDRLNAAFDNFRNAAPSS